MPYSNAWGATIQNNVPTAGDVTMTLTSGGVTCTRTAKGEIAAKDALAHCFVSQDGPAPRLWWLRYRIARAVATRQKWADLRASWATGNQNRTITRWSTTDQVNVTRTAAQWVAIADQFIAASQSDWDARVAEANAEGAGE